MTYLNQAATSYPKPQCVLEAHAAALLQEPSSQFRSSAATAREDVMTNCRKNLGTLFGIKQYERIFFTSGATASANTLICGLGLAGKHVLTTQVEHNSILRPLFNWTDKVGEVTIVPCDSYGNVHKEKVEEAMKPNTKALFINHCSNVTGSIQDIRAISAIAKEHGVLVIVDASQSAGCIPIKVDEWGIDGLIFTGHKSLFGIQGTGGYYLREGISLSPFQYGGTGRDSSRIIYQQENYEYEVGTQNVPGIAALNAGVEYILHRGVERIRDKEQEQMQILYQRLAKLPGIHLYGNLNETQGPVLSLTMNKLLPSDIAYILQSGYGITVRTGLHCAPLIHKRLGTDQKGTVRISISDLTTEEEIDELIEAMVTISKSIEVI